MPRTKKLTFMPFYWQRFFDAKHVQAMPTEARGIYALTLGLMWLNEGWLPADDRLIAGRLGIDVRLWKSRYKSKVSQTFIRTSEPVIGDVYRSPVLDEVWNEVRERVEKGRRQTLPARSKARQNQSRRWSKQERATNTVTEPVTGHPSAPVTDPVTGQGNGPVTGGKYKEEELLPINRQSSSSSQNSPTKAGVDKSQGEEGASHGTPEPAPVGRGDRDDQEALPEPRRAAEDHARPQSLFARLEARRKGREEAGGEALSQQGGDE